jgi:predicted SprT family Zn-dependent metalloprotease
MGECFDLKEIFDDLNERYFDKRIVAQITWGQRSNKRRRRNSIKMGSYVLDDKLIRIHRSLDREFVPRFFIEWVIYHEMLHEVHQAPVVNGRRQFHSKAFLVDEAKYEHYELAKYWERSHIDDLLTY